MVDLTVVVVTGATGAVVVTAGAAVVTGAARVVAGALWETARFLWWAFLWCTARLCRAAAAEEVALDVVDVEVVEAADEVRDVELVVSPELPQPAITRLAAMIASTTTFIRPTPVVALARVAKANNA